MVKRGENPRLVLEIKMPTVNLELQMKFLSELDDALGDALGRYSDDPDEKLAELEYMKCEIARARRIIANRMVAEPKHERKSMSLSQKDRFQEVAFS